MRRGLHSYWTIVLAGGLSVAAVVPLALVVIFWEWLSGGDSGSTTVRNVALVFVGIVALPLAIWRGVVADSQAKTAQRGLLNERYQKGAEMLGSDVLSVRLAGIYALQSLATEQQQYHIQVMRLFCAFVRLPTKDQSHEAGQAPIRAGTPMEIRQDVQSVMEAIGQRTETQKALERVAEFKLDLRGAELNEARIQNADLSSSTFHRSNLCGAYFANTDLTDAIFVDTDMSSAQFYEVDFTGTRLWSANLSGTMLQDAALVGMNLHKVSFSGANLGGANLSGSILQDATLVSAWFDHAVISGASFLKADLTGARLDKADLSGSTFLDANLAGANISEANVTGAQFSSAGRQPANGLTQAQLDLACADPDDPPELVGVFDAETGERLVWRGKALCHQA